MLRDVTDTLKRHVDKIFIISRDEEVLKYAESLNVNTILENDNSNLNKAMTQAMKLLKGKTKKIIIVPSDIPLIGKTNVQMVIDASIPKSWVISATFRCWVSSACCLLSVLAHRQNRSQP